MPSEAQMPIEKLKSGQGKNCASFTHQHRFFQILLCHLQVWESAEGTTLSAPTQCHHEQQSLVSFIHIINLPTIVPPPQYWTFIICDDVEIGLWRSPVQALIDLPCVTLVHKQLVDKNEFTVQKVYYDTDYREWIMSSFTADSRALACNMMASREQGIPWKTLSSSCYKIPASYLRACLRTRHCTRIVCVYGVFNSISDEYWIFLVSDHCYGHHSKVAVACMH
jgi:hypothetical protein